MRNLDIIRRMSAKELTAFLWQVYGDDDKIWFHFDKEWKDEKTFNCEDEIEKWLLEDKRE